MIHQETSICPSGPSYFQTQPSLDQQETQIILSELDQITFSLRNLLQKLDNLKIEVSTNKTSSTSDLRNKLSMITKQGLSGENCQSFLEKISQATVEFQEFTKTDKLVRVPSIEQPSQTSSVKAEVDFTVSEIIQIDLLEFDENEGKIAEDYEGLFNDVSPIASHENDNTFSRDCYYFKNQEESFVEEDLHETIVISENIDTISMSSAHIDLVEVEKNNGNRSSEDHDMSTNLSIEFEVNTHQDNTFDEDGMILKLLEKEEAVKKAALDLGSEVDLNDK